MNSETKSSYIKLAKNFYKCRLSGEALTPKKITDALRACASEYRPAYWRRLRNALAYDQEVKGYKEASLRINKVKNPVTLPNFSSHVKPKRNRIRSVSAMDESKLLAELVRLDDRASYSAVMLARITGARPAEMQHIRVRDDLVFIAGAKKTHDGQRGADRVLVLNSKELEMVALSVKHLTSANLKAVQARIAAAGHRIWPQRKTLPSLYSWRHQMGSDLKASSLDRREVAYLMGHQSTKSCDRYGNRRTARGRNIPRAPEGTSFKNIRELHTPSNLLEVPNLFDKLTEPSIKQLLGKYSKIDAEKSPKMPPNMRRSNEKSKNRQAAWGLQP